VSPSVSGKQYALGRFKEQDGVLRMFHTVNHRTIAVADSKVLAGVKCAVHRRVVFESKHDGAEGALDRRRAPT
jgi:hypothetical protein